MFIKIFNWVQKVHYIKFEKDQLLLESLTDYAKKNNIKTAEISFIGAVQNVNVMYMNQENKKYDKHTFDGGHEVLNGLGNISMLDDEPFVHVHMTVADKNGKALVSSQISSKSSRYLKRSASRIVRENTQKTKDRQRL